MFRVEFFVDDKKLADALRALAGKATGLNVQPVINAAPNGKAETSGGLLDMFGAWLGKTKIDNLTPFEIGQWLASQGYSKQSSSYLARNATKAGLLKKRGKGAGTTYQRVIK
jgi:hypothetical protein